MCDFQKDDDMVRRYWGPEKIKIFTSSYDLPDIEKEDEQSFRDKIKRGLSALKKWFLGLRDKDNV